MGPLPTHRRARDARRGSRAREPRRRAVSRARPFVWRCVAPGAEWRARRLDDARGSSARIRHDERRAARRGRSRARRAEPGLPAARIRAAGGSGYAVRDARRARRVRCSRQEPPRSGHVRTPRPRASHARAGRPRARGVGDPRARALPRDPGRHGPDRPDPRGRAGIATRSVALDTSGDARVPRHRRARGRSARSEPAFALHARVERHDRAWPLARARNPDHGRLGRARLGAGSRAVVSCADRDAGRSALGPDRALEHSAVQLGVLPPAPACADRHRSSARVLSPARLHRSLESSVRTTRIRAVPVRRARRSQIQESCGACSRSSVGWTGRRRSRW